MKMYFRKRLFLFSIISILLSPIIYADTCLKPFPQAVTYPYGIKPTNYTQAQMNAHTQAWFDKWRAKYVTQNNCAAGEWRVQRTETGNSIHKGCAENDTVSEGIAYGMVVMVYMSSATNNTKQYFDGMWLYYKNHLDGAGLMNWQIPYCDSGGAATDADQDVVQALIMADKQWGSAGAINYRNEAIALAAKVLANEFTAANDVRPGDGWDGGNPSYFAPYTYRMIGDYTGVTRWHSVATRTYQTIVNYYYNSPLTTNAALGIKTGLQPNWCNYDGTPWSPGAWAMRADTWWWDAIRHAWRQGYDYVLYGTLNSPLAYNNSARLSNFFNVKYSGNPALIKSHYTLDGTETTYCRNDRTPDLCDEDVKNLPGPVGAIAVAAMSGDDQTWLNALYDRLVNMDAGTGAANLTETGVMWGTDYFCDLLKMQYLLVLTGNMPNPNGNYPTPTPTFTWDPAQPTYTPTSTPVRGMFDDAETGALLNLDLPGTQTGFSAVTNATDRFNAGARSIKVTTTGLGWGGFGVDSPYQPAGGGDFTGATVLDFYVYSTSNINFFIKLTEGIGNGADGEDFSNRGNQIAATANGWRHITVTLSTLTRDTYTAVNGNNVLNLGKIKEFFFQIDGTAAGTVWIDDIKFTGAFPTYTHTPSATRTRTPFGSPTATPTSTRTGTNTPYYSPTITPTSTIFISATNSPTFTVTRTATITPTYTLTPNMPFGVFDDFETTVLKNPSTTDTGGGATLAIANTGVQDHTGLRSMSAVTGGTGWAVASIDSPYDGGVGYKDFTGATGISFWVNMPAATGFFIKIVESNGQQWSNRGAGFTTGAAGWQQITLVLSTLTVDAYSPAGDGDAVFDKDIIKSIQFQWDNPGTKTMYIDDITFTGMPVPTATRTSTRTPTFTRTSSYTPTEANTATYTSTPANTATITQTNTLTSTRSATVTNTTVITNTFTSTVTYTGTTIIFSATYTPTHTLTHTLTPSRTFTPMPTNTNTFTVTEVNTATLTWTRTFTPTVTLTNTVSPTGTLTPTGTPPTATVTPTITVTCTHTPTNTPTITETATLTHTLTSTATPTFSLTFTATVTVTLTNTPYQSPTNSPTGTPPTLTFTPTVTRTLTYTNTATPTFTPTYTKTATPTYTATFTMTNTMVSTAVNTATSTSVNTAVITATFTHTAQIYTPTASPTPTKEPRFLEITDPVLYPNPYNPRFGADLRIRVQLNKGCSTLKLKIYTTGYRRIFEKEFTGSFTGETVLTAASDNFTKLSNGTYYFVITGNTPDGETAATKIKTMIVIKLGG